MKVQKLKMGNKLKLANIQKNPEETAPGLKMKKILNKIN